MTGFGKITVRQQRNRITLHQQRKWKPKVLHIIELVAVSMNIDEINPEDPEQLFRVLDVIGQGSFGIVCTCINMSNDKIYAVKFIEINEDDGGDLQNEIEILKATTLCDFVVRYSGSYLKENYLMIVMEYCDGGSVLDVMQVCNRALTEKQIAAVCMHVLKGLNFMHGNKILHRDIKAGNVLLTREGRAKLADFGVSTKLLTTIQKHKTVVGSPYWMSPEVIVAPNGANGYDHKADIWSLGITAIEMAETKPPHYDINPLRVIFVIPNRAPPTLKPDGGFSSEFKDFVEQCLKKNPTERPSAAELLKHPFIVAEASTAEATIRSLVEETMPILQKAREKAEELEEDTMGGTVKNGTMFRVNTTDRTASFDEDYYATVQFNQSRNNSAHSNSNSNSNSTHSNSTSSQGSSDSIHNFTNPSSPQLANKLPEGAHATQFTSEVCAFSTVVVKLYVAPVPGV